jgi:hypothetical protein
MSNTNIRNTETYCGDNDVLDTIGNATNTILFGHWQDYSNKKLFVMWDQLIKLLQEQKDKLVTEGMHEKVNQGHPHIH